MLVCRRAGLYQASIHSKIAAPSSARDDQVCRSRSSRCIVDQNDSIIVLSTLDATRPIDPRSPASRSRWPKIQDVYCDPRSECTIVPGSGRRRHLAISSASTTNSERM